MENGKKPQLNDYKNLGRGPHTSYFRKLAARSVLPRGGGTFTRLAAFTTRIQNWPAWAWHFIKYAGSARYNPYPTYPAGEGIFPLADDVKLGIAGDWGTGTPEAQQVADKMAGRNSAYTIHLGDVYYVGDTDEVTQHCLGDPAKWKPGTIGSFALSGNHDMYSVGPHGLLGEPYFTTFLNSLGQRASFFCLRNTYWDILGLDTGYFSTGFSDVLGFVENIPGLGFLRKTKWFKPTCRLPDPLMSWLPGVLGDGPSTRGLILLTHHQSYSAFEDWYPTPAIQLQPLIGSRPVLWFWGHEHRMAIYDRFAVPGGISAFGRCIGHGGMPVEIGKDPINGGAGDCKCILYDKRAYDSTIDAGFNGYATFTFQGPRLQVDYFDLNDKLLVAEQWSVGNAGSLVGPHFSSIDPAMTTPGSPLP
ncbi:MAG TPA: metallophosphoesterase [Bryobacteraceae bacterium]|jgi:hypothetical protein|nr:metallophosphoesterase [Bryobacteraceae bacterium]